MKNLNYISIMLVLAICLSACTDLEQVNPNYPTEASFWKTKQDFYQGLILYASAFVHAQRGNTHGVRAQLGKAEKKLSSFRSGYLGVNVDAVLDHAARCYAILELDPADRVRSWSRIADVPRLELDPRLVRGDEPELQRVN